MTQQYQNIYQNIPGIPIESLAGRLSAGTCTGLSAGLGHQSISQLHEEPSQFEEPTKSQAGRVCSVLTSSPGNRKGHQAETL